MNHNYFGLLESFRFGKKTQNENECLRFATKQESDFFSFPVRMVTAILFFLMPLLASAQLTGVKAVGIEYPTIAAFVTDLNTQGVGAGGVTLTIPSGYTETAPAGGFSISATGTLANPIVIAGSGAVKPLITASATLTSGALNDAIFKIIGGDYITISGLELVENATNTTTAAATNNMTEWGIALLYATVSDGANNCSLINNTITLNRTYQNTFGIYANATHTATAVTTSATGTGADGGNSGLKIHSNSISNVNIGVLVVGPTAAADHNDGVEIGSSLATANTVTNFGTTGTFSSYANVSGTVNGILIRNSKNFTVSFNTITSSVGGTTAGALRGIFVPAFNNAPTGTFSNAINNNILDIKSGLLTGAVTGIDSPSTTHSATSTLSISNNTFNGLGHTTATASGTLIFISQVAPHLVVTVSGNTFNSLTANTTGSATFIAASYTMPTGGSQIYNNNQLTGGFNKTGAGGSVIAYTTAASSVAGSTHTATGNNFSGITVTGATAITGWSNNDGGAPTKIITGNTFSNWIGGTSQLLGMLQGFGGNDSNVSNNTITNLTGQGAIIGLSIGASNIGALQTVSNNTITNLSSTGTGGNVIGVSIGAVTATMFNVNNNIINTFSTTGASGQALGIISSAGANATVNIYSHNIHGLTVLGATPLSAGIAIIGTLGTVNVYKNKVYNVTATGLTTANGAANGIAIQGALNVNCYNNVIGDITNPQGSAINAIMGIQVQSTVALATIKVYDNSVYLNATSTGANFGTTGLFHSASATATTGVLDLRNNIIINQSAANGTGLTVAVRRSLASLANYLSASNRNLLYVGAPSVTNVIYNDGTTSYQTMGDFQTLVTPRETNSFTGETFTYGTPGSFFISISGANASFLKPVAGITTQVESGASNITAPLITDDYSSVIRAGNPGYVGTGTSPDLGAYEFEGSTPSPIIVLNSVTPPATSQCIAAARVVSATVTTGAGTITGVILNYAFNGVAQTPIVMTNTSGSVWEATIPVGSPLNALVTWSVSATNSIPLTSAYSGVSYSDEPLLGLAASATATSTTVCAGGTTSLTAFLSSLGTVAIGTSSSTSTSPAANPFYGGYGGVKSQYLIRASELTAAGLLAGNITSLSMNLTSAGSSLTGFAINVEATTLNVLTSTIETVNNQVFSAPTFTPVVGANAFAFSTPLNWDGTSNIILSICWSNNNTSNTASTVTITATSFVSGNARYVDSRTAVDVCGYTGSATPSGWNGAATTVSSRPNFIFSGVSSSPISNVSWSDGVSTVGTGNPFNVSPTAATTYTATITASGCVFTPSPSVAINVNPLPVAPTANNSVQCGTQIPTASVVDSNAFVSPTFNWYADDTTTTTLQSAFSATYQTAVSTTTTFYVSVLNPTTGCESLRTPVTVTVTAPQAITVTPGASASSCLGEGVAISASSSNASYIYSWTASPEAGSGVSGTLLGNAQTIVPTAVGTYVYTVSGTDGVCTALNTVTITVNEIPTAITISPSVVVACINTITPLVATGGTLSATGIIGTNTTLTTTTEQPTAFCNRWVNYLSQTIYTAAELSAAGINAGNITSLAYAISSLGDGATNANFTVKIGATSSSSFDNTTFLSTASYTTVYGPSTYTHSATGWQQITFSAPYVWDGVSNIVIHVSHDGADALYNSETYYSATASNTTLYTTNYSGTTTTGSLSPKRLNIRLLPVPTAAITWSPTTNLYSDAAATIPYVAATAATTVYFKSGTAGGPTTYTATATSANSCTSASTVAVTVNADATVVLATGSATQTVCSGAAISAITYTLTDATGATVTGLPAGVTGAYSAGVLTISGTPTASGVFNYTVTPTGCGSATATGTITVNATPAPTGDAAQTFVTGQTIADIVVVGTNVIWYASSSDAAAGINALSTSTPLVNAVTYYATQTVAGCTSATSLAVTVTVNLRVDGFDRASFTYYPNPVVDYITLTYSHVMDTVEVYNLLGQKVKTMQPDATTTQLDMSNLPSATYMIQVTSEGKTTIVKVIKK